MRRSFSTPALLVTLLTLLLIGSSCSQDSSAGDPIPASEANEYAGKLDVCDLEPALGDEITGDEEPELVEDAADADE